MSSLFDRVSRSAQALLDVHERVLLAVSGGLDSMVLLHAVARCARSLERVTVATFDHGTGESAIAAAALVEREAMVAGIATVVGRATGLRRSEAEWRRARWSFLRESAALCGAIVATAHHEDDQVETVVMRILRGAGARGLAGLEATSDIARPFLTIGRAELAAYAAAYEVPHIEDPSNDSPAHLRNRVRHDLLPALERARPRFRSEILDLAAHASRCRRALEDAAATFVTEQRPGEIRVARENLAAYHTTELCALWPAIAGSAGVTLDRRGTRRLAQFTISGTRGARIQVSGGVEIFRQEDTLLLRRVAKRHHAPDVCRLVGTVDFDGWRFSPAEARVEANAWVAELPTDAALFVRAWRPGDRMHHRRHGAARRVKRFLSDVRIAGADRVGWPVVLAGDEIVWVPGVRRSDAATARSGRPVVCYRCERLNG